MSIKTFVTAARKIGATIFDHDGEYVLSAEHGDGLADYYNDVEQISPKLSALEAKHGVYLEWQNPGCLSIYNG